MKHLSPVSLAFPTTSRIYCVFSSLSPAGDFLIVDPIEEGEKVKAEISFVLCKDHVRSLQKEGLW